MLEAIKGLFGLDKTDYAALVKQGAVILDVRSKNEFAGGHIKNSINIPLDQLEKKSLQIQQRQNHYHLLRIWNEKCIC